MTLRTLALLLILVAGADDPKKPAAKTDPEAVRKALGELAAGTGDWDKLTVTYDDLHGLHGGLTLTVAGTGKVTQKVVRKKPGEPKTVSKEDLGKLVKLLVEVKAWEQKVEDRNARADESKAKLTVTYGDHTATVWEWYNDLAANDRIAKVVQVMKDVGWKPDGK